MSLSKPSTSSNKRKFKGEWEDEFFCVPSGENVTCLICSKTLLGVFKGNVRRHYQPNHKYHHKIAGMERAVLLQDLKDAYYKENEEQAETAEDEMANLHVEFNDHRFRDLQQMENDCLLFANPMSVDVRSVHSHLQMEDVEMQNDIFIKSRCQGLYGSSIFEILPTSKYPNLRQFGSKMSAMLCTTYPPW